VKTFSMAANGDTNKEARAPAWGSYRAGYTPGTNR
jgi:hypothetical protein